MFKEFKMLAASIVTAVAVCGSASAQSVVYFEDFEARAIGDTITQNGGEFGPVLNMRNTVSGVVATNAGIPTQVLELSVAGNSFSAFSLESIIAQGLAAPGDEILFEVDIFESIDGLNNVQFRSNESAGGAGRVRDQFNPSSTTLGTNLVRYSQVYTIPLVDAQSNPVTEHQVFAFFGAPVNTANFAYLDNIRLTNNSVAVPEPSTLGLLASGLIGLCVRRRRK